VGRAAADVGSSGAYGWVRSALTGGIVAGVVAGVVLIVMRALIGIGYLVMVSLIFGPWRAEAVRVARRQLWLILKAPAYPFVGDRVLDPGFDARIVLLGTVTYLVSSICLGVLFGLVAHGRPWKAIIALGLLSGLLWWALDSYLIVLSPGALIEFIPSGLAMAITFRVYERQFAPREV
jgi:hypothetical protein